jgi:hypothetical protein
LVGATSVSSSKASAASSNDDVVMRISFCVERRSSPHRWPDLFVATSAVALSSNVFGPPAWWAL